MKKYVLAWMLVAAILMAGCTAGKTDESQATPSKETTAETTVETTAETSVETTVETTTEAETTAPEDTEPDQTEPANDELDDYLASIEEQSDILKASLQDGTLTQSQMNSLSQELYNLWDGALNDLWGKLQDSMADDDFDRLLDEQIQWIEDKEAAVEEAGKDYEGGSIYPMITNQEAASITEDRVYELFDLLKQQ